MSWPSWIERLKSRYLADEASVFLLHGPGVADGRWVVDGQTLDCLTTLNRFLRGSREVLAVVDPQLGISFADAADRNRFRGLVEAFSVLEGTTEVLREDHPREALAMVWRALSAAVSPAQGYVLLYAEGFATNHKKPVRPLPDGTPALSSWASHPTVREGDKVLVLITEEADSVHPELLGCIGLSKILVHDEHPAVAVTDEVTDLPELYDLPRARLAPVAAEPDELEAAFVVSFREALAAGTDLTESLPVRQALAQLAHAHGHFGGDSADEGFAAWFRGDVVLGAAAGQLMEAVGGDVDVDDVLHDNAQVRVLARRLRRLLGPA